MAPATGTAILILGAFVLPGFVTLLFRERTYAVRSEDSPFERLLTALYYSALIYVIALFAGWAFGTSLDNGDLVGFYEGHKQLGEYLLAGLVIAVLLPAAISETGRRWAGSEKLLPKVLTALRIDKGHSTRSSWNEMFSRKGTAMIRVTLNDGRVVGGYYGPGSLSSYSEHDQDLLISQRWVLDEDGWFAEPAPGSLGLWCHETTSPPSSFRSARSRAGTPIRVRLRERRSLGVDWCHEPEAPTDREAWRIRTAERGASAALAPSQAQRRCVERQAADAPAAVSKRDVERPILGGQGPQDSQRMTPQAQGPAPAPPPKPADAGPSSRPPTR